MRECLFCKERIAGISGNKSGICQKCWGELRTKIMKINKYRKVRGLKPFKFITT